MPVYADAVPDASKFPVVPGVKIREIIGRGGFATVYSGFQAAFNRHVAVKVLNRSELDVDARQRFDRECQVMGTLSNHPYIVTLYVAGFTEDERPYMVMPYISDGTLEDRIRSGGAMPWREVVKSGVLLAGALETAHRADVLHRDIKPANVLRAEYGDVLGDFGIARIAGGHETQSGVVTASIAHAPPEVLEGDPPDARADVYSLGSTLFEALAGRAAFTRSGDSVGFGSMIRQILLDAPPTLSPDDVPTVVAEVIEQAMSKDKTDRQATAAEFGEALRAAERSLSVSPTDMLVLGAATTPEPEAPVERVGGAAIIFDQSRDDPGKIVADDEASSPPGQSVEPVLDTVHRPRVPPPADPTPPNQPVAPAAGSPRAAPTPHAPTTPPPAAAAPSLGYGHPASPPATGGSTPTRTRWLIGAAVAAVVALLVGGGVVLTNQDDGGQEDGGPATTLDSELSVPPSGEVTTAPSTSVDSTTTTNGPTTTVDIAIPPLTLPPGDPVQIQFLNPGIQEEVLAEMVDRFEAEHPDITVDIVEEDSYRDGLESLLSGSVQPDVALLADRSIQPVLDQLDVVPVQNFIDDDDFDASRWLANTADMYSTTDGLAAMPFNVAVPMMYANADVLARAGIEIEPNASLSTGDLLDACAELADIVDICFEYGLPQFLFTEILTNSGGRVFDGDGFGDSAESVAFDTDLGRASFSFLVDSVIDGDARVLSGPRLLDSGQAAFYISTSSGLGSIDRAIDAADEPIDLIQLGLPHLAGEEPAGVVPGGGALWIFDTGDERRSIASWLLVEFLVELPQLQVFHARSGYVPPRSDAATDPAFVDFWSEKPWFRGAYDELVEASTTELPSVRDGRAGPYHAIDGAIADRMAQARAGELTTEAAFDALVADVNVLLAEYNAANE